MIWIGNYANEEKSLINEELINQYLKTIEFKFNPSDLVFYLPAEKAKLDIAFDQNLSVRRLVLGQDNEIFKNMESECTEDDLDAGYVELDQEFVYGTFLEERLIAFAGAYQHENFVYDIGVVTHPSFRRQGAGSMVVSSLCTELIKCGKIPQYRVQPQLTGSIAIAKSLGFEQVLEWLYEYQD